MVLRRWESEHENSVLSNELIKGRITTVIDLESWRSKRLVQKCVLIEFTDWTYNLTIKHEKE